MSQGKMYCQLKEHVVIPACLMAIVTFVPSVTIYEIFIVEMCMTLTCKMDRGQI